MKQIVKREPNEYYSFVQKFGEYYERMSKFPFEAKQRHYALAKRLIDKHGWAMVVLKTKLLAEYCKDGSVWFTRHGYSDFTIEKLSSMWNNLLPNIEHSKLKEGQLEFEQVQKHIEAHNDKVRRVLEQGRKRADS